MKITDLFRLHNTPRLSPEVALSLLTSPDVEVHEPMGYRPNPTSAAMNLRASLEMGSPAIRLTTVSLIVEHPYKGIRKHGPEVEIERVTTITGETYLRELQDFGTHRQYIDRLQSDCPENIGGAMAGLAGSMAQVAKKVQQGRRAGTPIGAVVMTALIDTAEEGEVLSHRAVLLTAKEGHCLMCEMQSMVGVYGAFMLMMHQGAPEGVLNGMADAVNATIEEQWQRVRVEDMDPDAVMSALDWTHPRGATDDFWTLTRKCLGSMYHPSKTVN